MSEHIRQVCFVSSLFVESLSEIRITDEVGLLTIPETTEEALNIINQHAHLRLTKADRAALWLAVLITQGLALLTIVPLYMLIRLHSSRETAWMCCSFWPFIPALSLFCRSLMRFIPFSVCSSCGFG